MLLLLSDTRDILNDMLQPFNAKKCSKTVAVLDSHSNSCHT